MNERIIELTEIKPKDFFGAQNSTIAQLKKYFPKIKIVARGSKIKIYGEPDILDEFEKRVEMLTKYFNKYNKLDDNIIERLVTSTGKEEKPQTGSSSDVLVHGVSGKQIKPQSVNQRKMVALMAKNDMLFAVGPAGTGKTYTAVALAVKALKEAHANVKGMIAIFSYGFDIATENFKNDNVALTTLSNYEYLLEQALDSQYITSEELRMLEDWRVEPSKWKQNEK